MALPNRQAPLAEAARELVLDQGPSPCAVGDDQDPFEVVDAFAAREMEGRGFPGAALAIAKDGEIVHAKGFGVKHAVDGGDVDAETQFRFGSVLKMMTAAAVMQQVEAGKVDISAPVQTYVPDFALADVDDAKAITVWNLLTHSTGIPDLFTGLDVDGPKTDAALGEWAASLGDVKPFAPPGSFWNYSNPNFSLAGLVAERASGTPYHELMADAVWATAGMTSTTLLPGEVMDRGNYTYGHTIDLETGQPTIVAPDAYDNWAFAPAGFGFTTAGDLASWAALLMEGGGSVLSLESAAAMQDPQMPLQTTPDAYYGYGIMIENYGDIVLRHHGGNINGWGAYVLWVPESDFAVATLNNADGNMISSVVCAVEAVLGVPPPASPDYTTDPATWGPYTGDYWVIDDLFSSRLGLGPKEYVAHLTLEGDTLRLALPDVQDPITPTLAFSRTLTQVVLDTFAYDFDLDGNVDGALAVTFIQDPAEPGLAKWMRSRTFVGTRMAAEPPRVYLPSLAKGEIPLVDVR